MMFLTKKKKIDLWEENNINNKQNVKTFKNVSKN